MKLFVGTNFDDQLLEELAKLGVYEVYGKGPLDEIGGARPSFLFPTIGKRSVVRHVRLANSLGIRFNYLLNGFGMDNLEYTRKGQRRIHQILDWLSEIGVDAVTLTIPYLMRIIQRFYPHIDVTVSSLANTDSVEKIKRWEDLGASSVTVNHVLCNRDFELLHCMAKSTDLDVRVIVNNGCLYSCPWSLYHPLISSISSHKGHRSRGFFIDSCNVECRLLKLSKPVELIKADWIRPEDLHHYEEIGIDSFKVVDRSLPTDEILLRARAYANRAYRGNLLDLIEPFPSQYTHVRSRLRMFLTFFRPFLSNPFRLPRLTVIQLDHSKVVIDNKKLDGFIDKFKNASCTNLVCDECGHCEKWAREAIRLDGDYVVEKIRNIRQIRDSLVDGSFYFYGRPCWNRVAPGPTDTVKQTTKTGA